MFSSLDESYTLLSMRPQISFSRNAGDLKALPKPDNDDRVAQAERLLHQAIRKPWKSSSRSRFKALSPFSRVKPPYIYQYGMNSYPEPPSPMTGIPQNAIALSTEPLEQRRGIDPMNVQAISSTQPPHTSNSKTCQSRVTPDKTSIFFSGFPLKHRATRELWFGYICLVEYFLSFKSITLVVYSKSAVSRFLPQAPLLQSGPRKSIDSPVGHYLF